MKWWKRYRWWLLALVAGVWLRMHFLRHHAFLAGDSFLYGDLAANLIRHHTYGFTEGAIRPTLIRLPGYPFFLAACFKVFGINNWRAVAYVQVGIDLLSCWGMGLIVRRLAGERAAMWVVWLAMLCPFTANYTVTPLTECLAIFFAVAAFYALLRWQPRAALVWTIVVGCALSGAILLRTDRGLLAVSVVGAMLWMAWRSTERTRRFLHVSVVCGLIVLPLSLWALRNWRMFHVFQPLAPHNALDAEEYESKGFERWYRTWAIDFASTENVYWNYDGGPLEMGALPPRAIDSPQQRAETEAAIANYNLRQKSTPAADAPFARLAAERVKAHPFAYYVGLPMARVANMWMRPRTEMLPVQMAWWQWTKPRGSWLAVAWVAINGLYVGLAAVGAWTWRRGRSNAPVVLAAMCAFVALRSMMLLTIDNSEPRYTMDCYPVVIILAGMACDFMGRASRRQQP